MSDNNQSPIEYQDFKDSPDSKFPYFLEDMRGASDKYDILNDLDNDVIHF